MPSPKNQYSAHLSNLVKPHTPASYAQLLYMFNPYFPYDNFIIPPGAWGMHFDKDFYASKSENVNHTSYSQNDKCESSMDRKPSKKSTISKITFEKKGTIKSKPKMKTNKE